MKSHLPHHDQGTADVCRSGFGGVDGNGSALGPNAQAKQEACYEELIPISRECLTETRDRADETGYEDDPPSVQKAVQRIVEPAGKGAAQVGGAVQKP